MYVSVPEFEDRPDLSFLDNEENAYSRGRHKPRKTFCNTARFHNVLRCSWTVLLYISRVLWAIWTFLQEPVYWMVNRILFRPFTEKERRYHRVGSILLLAFEFLKSTISPPKTEPRPPLVLPEVLRAIGSWLMTLYIPHLIFFYCWLTIFALNIRPWKELWKVFSPILRFLWDVSKWGNLHPNEIDRVKAILHIE